MSKRQFSWILAAIGLALVLLALFADTLGIAKWHGFGADQMLCASAGAVLAVVGGILAMRSA